MKVVTIDGKPVEKRTADAFLRMRKAASQDGVQIRIVSGFRSYAEQDRLYKLYLAGRGNLAARPGYSNHQDGHALDLNASAPGVYSWLSRRARSFGFIRTVPSENWHWEYRP
jgi:LAS superfamily LD-carboxypeptidase LdcB